MSSYVSRVCHECMALLTQLSQCCLAFHEVAWQLGACELPSPRRLILLIHIRLQQAPCCLHDNRKTHEALPPSHHLGVHTSELTISCTNLGQHRCWQHKGIKAVLATSYRLL